MNLKDNIEELGTLKSELAGRDFLLTWEKSETDLRIILGAAENSGIKTVHQLHCFGHGVLANRE